jgi:hypothetical protein
MDVKDEIHDLREMALIAVKLVMDEMHVMDEMGRPLNPE